MRERRPGGARSTLSELWWRLPRLSHAGNGRAFGVLSVWIGWDYILEWLWRPRLVRPGGVLRYRRSHHLGRRLTLEDGTVIARGDPVLELHFDNRRLLRTAGAPDWDPWETIEEIEADLKSLAAMVRSGGPPFLLPRGRARRGATVRALRGITLFASPGRRLGFELHPVPHTWAWSLQRFYLISLLPIYHRDGWREFERMRRNRWPAELWMSVDQLRARWQVKPSA